MNITDYFRLRRGLKQAIRSNQYSGNRLALIEWRLDWVNQRIEQLINTVEDDLKAELDSVRRAPSGAVDHIAA